ncbi:unnamed protein product [Dovyalis caffra]|uniref:Poly [ADP-ribose] polymerase n=1 Tax=Dovyalis caffra TaxID=77055 RepID=A0AAV1S666_9ROSI|nr:unnamed protein product [Dovyalis caffra]
MANFPKPWKVEYAKSARSSCKICQKIIAKEVLRLGKMVPATRLTVSCLIDDVEGVESLRWEDQQKLRKYVESCDGGPPGKKAAKVEYGIELSQTSRAPCKGCKQRIKIGEVIVCSLEKLSGWESLSASDQEAVQSLVKKVPSTAETGIIFVSGYCLCLIVVVFLGIKDEGKEEEELPQSTVKAGGKRRNDVGRDQKSKFAKGKGDMSTSRAALTKKDCDFDSKLEAQSKELWALKDDLKKHVTALELRAMLEANGQNSTGSELDLRDRWYYCSSWGFEPGTASAKMSWFKSQKSSKPVRILPPTSDNPFGSQETNTKPPSESESLGDLKVAVDECQLEYVEEWKGKIDGVGGQSDAKIKKDTNCLAVSGAMFADIRKAKRTKLPIVREDYLVDCLKRKKKLPFDSYKVEALCGSSVVTVRVKGRSAVHEYSGMQETGHILEDGKSIYNTTLNMSDLSTGVNRFAWFGTRLFHDWLFRLTSVLLNDYGVPKQVTRKSRNRTDSKLAPPVIKLMKMLFNVERYRAAMMEFEINMSEMPLGKLSKSNIQNGFEALTEIQNLFNSNAHDPSVKESLIIDASNKFFTVIPSIHPHVIRHEDNFKSKVKMLEALQDIEIASRLVGFDANSDESLDDKYKKLHCGISPLPHDSEDYQLIEKYLLTTHAPTHTDWRLELEEVFSLEREGELDRFAPCREKLKKKMLLWHGSRLTNFVGILSQGLRIALPEAPPTGYMFGKGIYFADLVSKSAQYCYTADKNPVGLMLLSEVALGEVCELKKAMYMESLSEGKHSTKGLGKKVPRESEFVKWRNDVIVPCGKPVGSNVRASELMYNEYNVYNTDQVSSQEKMAKLKVSKVR